MPRTTKKQQSSSRADRVAQAQRQSKSAERRRLSVIWVALGVVIAVIAALVTWAIVTRPVLTGVETFDNVTANHVLDRRPDYDVLPPPGGDHHPRWWTCGIYEDPIPDHHAVHSLEHGAVWLTYQPDLPEEQIEQLRRLANQTYMLLSPYPGQDAPVIATAWANQLKVDDAGDERLRLFVREFRQGPQTPEPNATCLGGTVIDEVPDLGSGR